ncbi:neutral zinc metallopeptidase [Geodermatophilus ruber]|uniref:Neutral zinc metallopeptidase n=1 Tax=Geodermatophilus ruber TaxID=504800 RepID=A0A1I4KN41_9ACTN|nr:neutral zinc metallopeptidase [Geodermatophilus ruber]SFL80178.1 hypothetical protein SAMN04488085_11850 [Geodermatophilus ruber]
MVIIAGVLALLVGPLPAFASDQSGGGADRSGGAERSGRAEPDPLEGLSGAPTAPSVAEVEQYVTFVVNDLQKNWAAWFRAQGIAKEPDVVVHLVGPGESYRTTCVDRTGTSPVVTSEYQNLFYCSTDTGRAADGTDVVGSMVLPVVTLQRMWSGDILGFRSSVPGDFAAAVSVAHEFGHSVVDERGTALGGSRPTGQNLELIADCMAGVWMAWVQREGLLEAGDVEEAIATLEALSGTTATSGWNRSGGDRVQALNAGFSGGGPEACIGAYWK